MAEKRKAAGDAPGTPRPPARLKAADADDEDVSPDASLLGGARGSDGNWGRAVVVPPPPLPQQQPVVGKDANPTAQRREDRDLLSNSVARAARDFALGFLHGRMAASAASAAAGEEEEVVSSWKSLPPSPQASPSGKGKELAAAPQARSPPHADQSAAAAAAQEQPLPHADQSAAAAAAAEAAQPPASQPAVAANDYVWCKGCGYRLATVRRVPVRHVCRCVPCRNSNSPDARPCSFCNGTRR